MLARMTLSVRVLKLKGCVTFGAWLAASWWEQEELEGNELCTEEEICTVVAGNAIRCLHTAHR